MTKQKQAEEGSTRRKRITASRKMEAAIRVVRGEDMNLVARSLGVTAADVSRWQEEFMAAGTRALEHQDRSEKDEEIDRLHAKVDDLTMVTELLQERAKKAEETNRPLARKRSKR